MNLVGFTIEQVEQAIAACNAGEYDKLEFQQTDHEHLRRSKRTGNPLKRRYIAGVLRTTRCDAPGALIYPHRRTRFVDWQGHYDFMEQLLLLQPNGVITSRRRGDVKYVGLLGFYGTAGRIATHRMRVSGHVYEFGAMPSHRND